jgi:ATP-dependent 26S proteasome regulatory subunit
MQKITHHLSSHSAFALTLRIEPSQVARCTLIINPGTDESKYVINVKQIAKFVVGLGDKVSPTDIEEGMRVGFVFHSSTLF